MATENLNFTAAVDDWAKESADRLERIFKASSQELASIAIQWHRSTLVSLRASFRASNESMPAIDPSARKSEGASVSLRLSVEINGYLQC
jgi:hypothetical protein